MISNTWRRTLAAAACWAIGAGAAAQDLKIGANSQRAERALTCEAAPGAEPMPDGPVYRVPTRKCDVADMTIAVFQEGRFRAAYGPAPNPKHALEASQAIDPVIERLKEQAAKLKPGQPLRILIFAHGGKVSHTDAISQAESLAPAMLADGFSPVFLVWNSDFPTAYYDRLCCVRDGERNTEAAPANIVSRGFGDVAASIVRSPQNFGGQALRFRNSVIRQHHPKYYLAVDEDKPGADHGLCFELKRIACPTLVFPPYKNDDELNGRYKSDGREVAYVALAPVRVVATLVAPEVGAQAWNNMVRRTRMAFQRSGVEIMPTPENGCLTKSDSHGEGGFAIFFDRLACEIDTPSPGMPGPSYLRLGEDKRVPVEIQVFGHSMGAFVGEEALALHPELPWTKLVYMAAATTVRDFRLTAAPTLQRHPETHFYNLTLHPLNESRELVFKGVAPQGSLLEWIDEMFEGPRSPDERTLGKWNNFRDTARLLPEDIRSPGRMTVRVFAKDTTPGAECERPPGGEVTPHCHPRAHGDFDDFSFWRTPYLDGPPAVRGGG